MSAGRGRARQAARGKGGWAAGAPRARSPGWVPGTKALESNREGVMHWTAAWRVRIDGSRPATLPQGPAHTHSTPCPQGCPTPPTQSLQHRYQGSRDKCVHSKAEVLSGFPHLEKSNAAGDCQLTAGHRAQQYCPHRSEVWSRRALWSASPRKAPQEWHLHSSKAMMGWGWGGVGWGAGVRRACMRVCLPEGS